MDERENDEHVFKNYKKKSKEENVKRVNCKKVENERDRQAL